MFKKALLGFTCFLAGLFTAVGITSQAQTLRLELTTGITKHSLAPEGSWHYSGFDTDNRLLAGSFQAGVLWLPLKHRDWSYGFRAGYADLGTVTAENSFPIFEFGGPADARVNPVCDRTTLYGCTGKFSGRGKTRGWYMGPAVERDFGGGVALGLEAGAYIYKSDWTANNLRVVDNDGTEFIPAMWDSFKWDRAKSTHTTAYIGANARWNYVFITGRAYANVRASRADENPGFVGMTSGPVWSLMAGVSIPL